MTTVENALLRQMQKMAANMSSVPSVGGKNQNTQNAVSFQELLQQSGGKTASASEASEKEPQDKPLKEAGEAVEEAKNPDLPVKEKEELKAENLTGNPNAVNVLDLIRPEIVETAEQVEAAVAPIPEETVEGASMDLGGQAAGMETSVDAGIGAEVSMEQQPRDFQQAMEEAPQQPAAENIQTQQQTQPVEQSQAERPVQEKEAARPEREAEVPVERTESEEPTGEAAAPEQPVFHETEAVPVKVGERYETVDTQKPEMDSQMADVIRTAVQTGQERIEIHLNPQNLGSLTIEMTKDASGLLQVVLHAATPKAEGLLNQHLNGLYSALQSYGQENIRLEVQRGQESQQQNLQHQADPDGRGQNQQRQQQERQEESRNGEAFMQKLRLGLFGSDDDM